MVSTPGVIPVNTPVVAPIVAIAVLLTDHVSPGTDDVNVIELPEQTFVGPEITGIGETVTTIVAIHPDGSA